MLPGRIFLKPFVQLYLLLLALSVHLVFHLLELLDAYLDSLLLYHGLLLAVIVLLVSLLSHLCLRCVYVRQAIGLDVAQESLEDAAPDLVHEGVSGQARVPLLDLEKQVVSRIVVQLLNL